MVYSDILHRNIPDIPAQLSYAKSRVRAKINPDKFAGYIAYFQAYTNTYAEVPYLEQLFLQVLEHDDILGLPSGTCFGYSNIVLSLGGKEPYIANLSPSTCPISGEQQ